MHVRNIDLEVVKEKIPDPAVRHRQTLDVDSFKSQCFKVQAGMDSPTPGVFYKSFNATDISEAIYVSAPGEEAPVDGWWQPN